MNYTSSKELRAKQGLSFLADMESDRSDVIYNNSVRWLIMGRLLKKLCLKTIKQMKKSSMILKSFQT